MWTASICIASGKNQFINRKFIQIYMPVLSGSSVGPPPEVDHWTTVPDAWQRPIPSRRQAFLMVLLMLMPLLLLLRLRLTKMSLIFIGIEVPRLVHSRPQIWRRTKAPVGVRTHCQLGPGLFLALNYQCLVFSRDRLPDNLSLMSLSQELGLIINKLSGCFHTIGDFHPI